MKRSVRRRRIGLLSLGLIAVAAIVVVLTVFAATNDTNFTATGYSEVIRFQADGVATLQVRVFDLSGKVVWDSSIVSGDTIDWNRNNDFGERLAYGAYIYSAQGWSAQGDLIFQKNGKLALMPGDQVQLQAAPTVTTSVPTFNPLEDQSLTVQPKALYNEDIVANVGYNFVNRVPSSSYNSYSLYDGSTLLGRLLAYGTAFGSKYFGFVSYRSDYDLRFYNSASDTSHGTQFYTRNSSGSFIKRLSILGGDTANVYFGKCNVGIGTASPTAKLEIESSTGQDLIAAYNSSNRVFVVKSTGEVRADGAYYSGAGDCNTGGFNAGGADVAERINVSEWVDAGCVVEIDPAHPGFFRKSSSPYSTKVAGIISTSPGVVLGNSFDEATDDWEDNRPVLAVTGRVPCKVSAENGPIQIGDLLVASSTPGIAMKGNPEESMGAVVGKAMEPLENGEGTIVVQVMLR